MSKKNNISIVNRLIALFLAIYLFNFSIDSKDAEPDHIAEDLSFNDIESIYELLAENILGIEKAVNEHDEKDSNEGGAFEFKKFFFSQPVSKIHLHYLHPIKTSFVLFNWLILPSELVEIDSPPPKRQFLLLFSIPILH